jgi:uncharacterized protein YbaA (DUF1428 family)
MPHPPCGPALTDVIKLKAGETLVFSWMMYKSRTHKDAVIAKTTSDPRMIKIMSRPMPFDTTRMYTGEFEVAVSV